MRIINVIESQNNSVQHITSFCCINEKSIESVLEKAVEKFKTILNSKFNIPKEDMDMYVEDGFYDDNPSGYVLSITESDEIY
jgi:hypothetical protein